MVEERPTMVDPYSGYCDRGKRLVSPCLSQPSKKGPLLTFVKGKACAHVLKPGDMAQLPQLYLLNKQRKGPSLVPHRPRALTKHIITIVLP
ncbi:hypothetical protein C4D60_Mb05t12940 [Musa balbisiana]|uniref:Uncharacterized protein n=1 Tax=Musa balbisiana TaxID=52838 RepID=A0A4S8JVQ7_MUSBA|nr:hypothetical protein C4D60_Mb05t12940 [Musa balbisiana]